MAITAALLWWLLLGSRSLLNPDEGRYAEIAREMLVSGDWVTPRLNGIQYFEKPPLQYWMTALTYQVFGLNEFAARFWTGLTGFAGLLLAWYTGNRLFGRPAGMLAAAVLGSSVLYVVIGHLNTLDMGLSFCLQLTVSSFLLAQRAPAGSASERHWMWLAWLGAALAFLSKGLIAFILPALTLLAYTVICREYSAWKRLHMLTGLPILLVVCLPWLIAASLRNPEFARFFLWHEQFERFLSDSHERDGPWWYFLPLLAAGTLPWLFIWIRQAWPSWRSDRGDGFQVRRFLWLWVIVVMGFFSLSHSKLPPYITPVLPMLALLCGDRLQQLSPTLLKRHWQVMGGVALILAITIALLPDTIAGTKNLDLVRDLRPETAAAFSLIGLTLLAVARLAGRLGMVNAVLSSALGTLLGLSVLMQGADALRVTRSGVTGVAAIQQVLHPETRLYSVGDYDQTLPFYLQRTLTLVNYRGELDFGLQQQPELAIDSLERFIQHWQTPGPTLAIVTPTVYDELQRRQLPLQVVTRHANWIAIQKPD